MGEVDYLVGLEFVQVGGAEMLEEFLVLLGKFPVSEVGELGWELFL